MTTPTTPEERWSALVLAVRAEFWNAGQDPETCLFTLFELRLLRGRLTDPPAAPEWFTLPVTAQELDEGDPRDVAREFYRRYRLARARQPG